MEVLEYYNFDIKFIFILFDLEKIKNLLCYTYF